MTTFSPELRTLLGRVQIGASLTTRTLSGAPIALVPLLVDGGVDADLLAEAVAHHAATVSEVDESGRVGQIRLRHAGARPLLLLHGEEVVGAKQNRILNASFPAIGRFCDR